MTIYGPGRGLLSAVGEVLNDAAGHMMTRLVAPLPPAGHVDAPDSALVAEVETTHGFPATGEIVIRGERIRYGTTAIGRIEGLQRDPFVVETYRRGEVVALVGDFSALDAAKDSLLADRAEGPFLSAVGHNYGVHRILGAEDELYRRLIQTLAHMPAKGARTSIDAFLWAVLGDQGLTGGGAETTATGDLVAAEGTFKPGMRRLLVDLRTPTRRRRTRVVDVSADGSTLHLDRRGSPHWAPADLDDETDVVFHVLPFEVVEPAHHPCTVWIRVRTRPPETPLGWAYLQGHERVTPTVVDQVEVAHDIRQVLGVWLATDRLRTGTNYATTNAFEGRIVHLDTPLPGGLPDVVVDYGSIFPPAEAPVSGIPGGASGMATAGLLAGVQVRNPTPIIEDGVRVGETARYPLYLGGRLSLLLALLGAVTVAGVIPELEIGVW